jgi:hypothetical protein
MALLAFRIQQSTRAASMAAFAEHWVGFAAVALSDYSVGWPLG